MGKKKVSEVQWCFDCVHQQKAKCCQECMAATQEWVMSNHEEGENKPFFMEREEGDIDDS